jgi:hypothetical protein
VLLRWIGNGALVSRLGLDCSIDADLDAGYFPYGDAFTHFCPSANGYRQLYRDANHRSFAYGNSNSCAYFNFYIDGNEYAYSDNY